MTKDEALPVQPTIKQGWDVDTLLDKPPLPVQPEQEPVTWRNAAIRVGEDLCSVGPFRYYDMTAEQWLDWALSVVTVHTPPKRPWVGLTDEERDECDWGQGERDYARIIEAKLKEKNT